MFFSKRLYQPSSPLLTEPQLISHIVVRLSQDGARVADFPSVSFVFVFHICPDTLIINQSETLLKGNIKCLVICNSSTMFCCILLSPMLYFVAGKVFIIHRSAWVVFPVPFWCTIVPIVSTGYLFGLFNSFSFGGCPHSKYLLRCYCLTYILFPCPPFKISVKNSFRCRCR